MRPLKKMLFENKYWCRLEDVKYYGYSSMNKQEAYF